MNNDLMNLSFEFSMERFWKLKFQMIEENDFESNEFVDEMFEQYVKNTIQGTILNIDSVRKDFLTVGLINHLNNIESPNERLRLLVRLTTQDTPLFLKFRRSVIGMVSFLIKEIKLTFDDVEPFLNVLSSKEGIEESGFYLFDLIYLEDKSFRNIDLFLEHEMRRLNKKEILNIRLVNSNSRKIGLSKTYYKNLEYLVDKLEQLNRVYTRTLCMQTNEGKFSYFNWKEEKKYILKKVLYPINRKVEVFTGLKDIWALSENIGIVTYAGFIPSRVTKDSNIYFEHEGFYEIKYFHFLTGMKYYALNKCPELEKMYDSFLKFFQENVSEQMREEINLIHTDRF